MNQELFKNLPAQCLRADDDDDVDEDIPLISGSGEGIMDEPGHTSGGSARRKRAQGFFYVRFGPAAFFLTEAPPAISPR